jgi:Fic family protein
LLRRQQTQPDRLAQIVDSGIGAHPAAEYLHWDELRYKPVPAGFTHEEWWLATKLARTPWRFLPLHDKADRPFRYSVPDAVQSLLHTVDRQAAGQIQIPETGVITAQVRDRYVLRSLIDEAITSSQLEGAATTHRVAKEMLQRHRAPRTRDERMISNNYAAMQFIREHHQAPLTPTMILELHRILTAGTLDDEGASGRWRLAGEDVTVVDHRTNETLHVPPEAHELPARMELVCRFANDSTMTPFVHPVVRAIVLHFMLGYDHPFVDGNGRTARALFYWCMAHQEYWLIEFLSISTVLRKAPAQYVRAYLHTETDDSDVTYFILHQLRVIDQAITDLHTYLRSKAQEERDAERLIRRSPALQQRLNPRQLAVLDDALRHPGSIYRITSHRARHDVTYQTARTDLLGLAAIKLLEQSKSGRAFVFVAPEDLRERLDALKERR